MPPEQDTNNQAVLLATKPIRPVVAAVAIALILSLALSALVQNVNNLKTEYLSIINDQEMQLAAVIASKSQKPVTETKINDQAPKETNRIIVKYKDDTKLPPGLIIAAERANLEKAQGLVKVVTIKAINAEVYQVSDDDVAQEVVDRILSTKRDLVEYAEVDRLVAPDFVPNDPNLSSAWHLNKVQTPTAWDGVQGEGIVIAIADTGVDCAHPDLAASCVPGWNVYANNNDTRDTGAHGTAVAGVAAQIGDNAIGSAGIAYRAKIMPIQITDGVQTYAYFSDMAEAIIYAADNGARVANVSYQNSCSSSAVSSAANYMRAKGGVVTLCAGNSGGENAFAKDVNHVCVSATESNDARTSWSSFGQYIDVSAPGANIFTTNRGGGYGNWNGTSFSAPLTAGIYALMFSANPKLTPNQADNILYSTADDLGEPGWDIYYGYGRVNAAKAVAAAKGTVGTQDTVPPSVPANLRTTSVTSNSLSLVWNASTDDNTGVASYDVYENNIKVASIGGTTYNRTGLNPTTVYTYNVKAIDGAGNTSANSNLVTASTTDIAFGISSYSVPTKTTTGATLSTTLTKLGTVTIKYGTTNTNLNLSAQSSTQSTTHSVSLTGLTAATTYYYQVVATDAYGTVISSSISSFKTNRATGGGKKR